MRGDQDGARGRPRLRRQDHRAQRTRRVLLQPPRQTPPRQPERVGQAAQGNPAALLGAHKRDGSRPERLGVANRGNLLQKEILENILYWLRKYRLVFLVCFMGNLRFDAFF